MKEIKKVKGWNQEAHAAWERGERVKAVQSVVASLNESSFPKPVSYFIQLGYYFFIMNDYASACMACEQAYKLDSKDFEVVRNYAASLVRYKQYQKAIEVLNGADQSKVLNDFYSQDILCGAFSKLSFFDKAKCAGERSLLLKSGKRRGGLVEADVSELVKKNLQDESRQDVISFSLWGNDPCYLRGALDNLIGSKYLYPGWICRFYLDGSVPESFVCTLRELGAEVAFENESDSLGQKLTWRFKVLNDQGVRRFLIRDVDSVVNKRELDAVLEWVSSGQAFHVMRDWWTHTDPILAGMWGGVSGVIADIDDQIAEYDSGMLETPNIDQWFLRDCIWPNICDYSLIHDRCFSSYRSVDWPTAVQGDNSAHVGQDVFAVQKESQLVRLKYWVDKLPCLKVRSNLLD
ncbi:tetratricopeptide repeat protein [Marinomonas sp. 2405UD68-3]|uniref:tetratricopeptide repeat protein n=1 Tax=Marinomonas sp. 2405UD68-3 TaxID=3391835 RepID=UPI0039C9A22E